MCATGAGSLISMATRLAFRHAHVRGRRRQEYKLHKTEREQALRSIKVTVPGRVHRDSTIEERSPMRSDVMRSEGIGLETRRAVPVMPSAESSSSKRSEDWQDEKKAKKSDRSCRTARTGVLLSVSDISTAASHEASVSDGDRASPQLIGGLNRPTPPCRSPGWTPRQHRPNVMRICIADEQLTLSSSDGVSVGVCLRSIDGVSAAFAPIESVGAGMARSTASAVMLVAFLVSAVACVVLTASPIRCAMPLQRRSPPPTRLPRRESERRAGSPPTIHSIRS